MRSKSDLQLGIHDRRSWGLISTCGLRIVFFLCCYWNSCRWRQRRMFWVTWQNAREYLPSRCVAQFFLALVLSRRSLAFDTDNGFFYHISFPEDRCEVMTPDENEVATCDDHLQILRHKLESLILKHTDSWHGISRLPSKIPWCWIPSSAMIESIMLPRRLSSSFPSTKNLLFLLTEKPAITRWFLACLRSAKECDHVRLPIRRHF